MIWIVLSICIAQTLSLHSKTLKKWPDSTVYFDIDPFLPKEIKDTIKSSIQYIHLHTCARWEQRYPWSNTTDYVTFRYFRDTWNDPHCSAPLGMMGGRQALDIGRNCWRLRYGKKGWERRTILHEMLHTLGLQHEHQRPDRDCYVKTPDGPITEEYQFSTVSDPNEWVDDFPYDYHSVMHYITQTGLVALNKSITELGRNDGTLSPTDIKKIASLYCGTPSFCHDPMNVQTCRDIWADKVNRNCSDWADWLSSSNNY